MLSYISYAIIIIIINNPLNQLVSYHQSLLLSGNRAYYYHLLLLGYYCLSLLIYLDHCTCIWKTSPFFLIVPGCDHTVESCLLIIVLCNILSHFFYRLSKWLVEANIEDIITHVIFYNTIIEVHSKNSIVLIHFIIV